MRWWVIGFAGVAACSASRGGEREVDAAESDVAVGDTTFPEVFDSGAEDVVDVGDTGRPITVAERCEGKTIDDGDCGCLDSATIDFADARFDCFVCGLWACREITGGFHQALGSTYVSSVRYATDMCYYRFTAEIEGGVTVYDCSKYPGFAPWPALLNDTAFPDPASDGVYCTVVTTCSVLDPERPCGTDVLGCGL